MMRFLYVEPENLREHWPKVRVGLERILVTSPERWIPEDIHTHIKIKAAQLYLGFDGETYRGFLLTESKRDVFTNAPYVNVWCVYAEPINDGHFADVEPLSAETIQFLDGLAKQIGAKEIRMSGRKGWERFLAGQFTVTRVCYERKVPC